MSKFSKDNLPEISIWFCFFEKVLYYSILAMNKFHFDTLLKRYHVVFNKLWQDVLQKLTL